MQSGCVEESEACVCWSPTLSCNAVLTPHPRRKEPLLAWTLRTPLSMHHTPGSYPLLQRSRSPDREPSPDLFFACISMRKISKRIVPPSAPTLYAAPNPIASRAVSAVARQPQAPGQFAGNRVSRNTALAAVAQVCQFKRMDGEPS